MRGGYRAREPFAGTQGSVASATAARARQGLLDQTLSRTRAVLPPCPWPHIFAWQNPRRVTVTVCTELFLCCCFKRLEKGPSLSASFMVLLFAWPREPFDLIALILMFSLPFAAAIKSDRACITGLLLHAPQVMEGRELTPSFAAFPRRVAQAQRSTLRHIQLPN